MNLKNRNAVAEVDSYAAKKTNAFILSSYSVSVKAESARVFLFNKFVL